MADKKIVDTLVGVFVGAILAAALIPVALQQLATANTSGLDASTVALFGVIGIAIVVVVVVLFFKLI